MPPSCLYGAAVQYSASETVTARQQEADNSQVAQEVGLQNGRTLWMVSANDLRKKSVTKSGTAKSQLAGCTPPAAAFSSGSPCTWDPKQRRSLLQGNTSLWHASHALRVRAQGCWAPHKLRMVRTVILQVSTRSSGFERSFLVWARP